MKQATIIMVKVPIAGKVKTRLKPLLTANQSAEIAKNFLLDIENKTRNTSSESIIAFSPTEEKSRLIAILQHEHILIEQEGDNLGERITNAFDKVLRLGFERVVMIGTDSPTFPEGYINDAFDLLQAEADVVLGKTEDGGFYLVGISNLRPEIFSGIEWSSERTSRQIIQKINSVSLSLRLLPEWYDVDLPEDLIRLKKQLTETPELAVNTAKWLMKM